MMNPEEIITCPYNKAHSIISNRMQFHLSRCRAQHPNTEKTTCPFNSTHIVNKIELDIHQRICESRLVLDLFTSKIRKGGDAENGTRAAEPPIQFDECWDDDLMDGSVLENVKRESLNKPALTALIGAPKSERKAHRFYERLRIQEVLYRQEIENKLKSKEQDTEDRSIIDCKMKKDMEVRSSEKHSPENSASTDSTTNEKVFEVKNEEQPITRNPNVECDNFIKVIKRGSKWKNTQKSSNIDVEKNRTALQLTASSSQANTSFSTKANSIDSAKRNSAVPPQLQASDSYANKWDVSSKNAKGKKPTQEFYIPPRATPVTDAKNLFSSVWKKGNNDTLPAYQPPSEHFPSLDVTRKNQWKKI